MQKQICNLEKYIMQNKPEGRGLLGDIETSTEELTKTCAGKNSQRSKCVIRWNNNNNDAIWIEIMWNCNFKDERDVYAHLPALFPYCVISDETHASNGLLIKPKLFMRFHKKIATYKKRSSPLSKLHWPIISKICGADGLRRRLNYNHATWKCQIFYSQIYCSCSSACIPTGTILRPVNETLETDTGFTKYIETRMSSLELKQKSAWPDIRGVLVILIEYAHLRLPVFRLDTNEQIVANPKTDHAKRFFLAICCPHPNFRNERAWAMAWNIIV